MRQVEQRPSGGHKRWAWVLVALACIPAAYVGWQKFKLGGAHGTARAASVTQSAPVHVGVAKKGSFAINLNGLGTVQATNSVVVRSRVDGQIEKVAFEEGQMLHEGDLLVQIDAAPFQAAVHQAVAKLAQDQASLINAKQDLERTTILSKQGNATLQLFDQRTATVANLTAALQADQAAIESAQVQLAYTTIRSPLTGRAGFRLVDPGNIVHANDQNGILTITQLQPISVIFSAPEQDLPQINEALKGGPLAITAFSSDGRTELGRGQLSLVDNQVDTASGTIRLKATFDNSEHKLWPGLSVSTKLRVKTLDNVVVVPASAVQRGPNGLYVYVVTADSKAELRSVKVSHTEDKLALVDQGLVPSERVVTSGQYRVQPGAALQILDNGDRTAGAEKTGSP